MIANALLLVATGLALGTPAPEPAPAKDDLARLQGTWDLVAIEEDGRPGEAGPLQVRFRLEKERLSGRSLDNPYEEIGVVRLDPARTPREMDVTFKNKEKPDELAKCIYQLDGDTLKVAYLRIPKRDYDADFAKDRPTGFKVKAEAGKPPYLRVLTLKRVKP